MGRRSQSSGKSQSPIISSTMQGGDNNSEHTRPRRIRRKSSIYVQGEYIFSNSSPECNTRKSNTKNNCNAIKNNFSSEQLTKSQKKEKSGSGSQGGSIISEEILEARRTKTNS